MSDHRPNWDKLFPIDEEFVDWVEPLRVAATRNHNEGYHEATELAATAWLLVHPPSRPRCGECGRELPP